MLSIEEGLFDAVLRESFGFRIEVSRVGLGEYEMGFGGNVLVLNSRCRIV